MLGLRYSAAARTIESRRMRAVDFSLIKVIGRGAFGEVQLVSDFLQQPGSIVTKLKKMGGKASLTEDVFTSSKR